MKIKTIILLKFLLVILISCETTVKSKNHKSDVSKVKILSKEDSLLLKGMVFIPGGTFKMGSNNKDGFIDEFPQHEVKVNSFWMDETEVTNSQFEKFVNATGYITTAERKIDWEVIKKTLPPGTPKPNDSLLLPSSLLFLSLIHI